jgi:hypothetical protein
MEKDQEVVSMENEYTPQNKFDYFEFAINKVYNSTFGVSSLGSEVGLSHEQLAFCIYYVSHPTMTLEERFNKFVKVLTLKQIYHIGF